MSRTTPSPQSDRIAGADAPNNEPRGLHGRGILRGTQNFAQQTVPALALRFRPTINKNRLAEPDHCGGRA